MSTKYAMNHGDNSGKKTIAKKAVRSKVDGDCEECGSSYDKGTWVLAVNEAGYEFNIHEVCPEVAAAVESVEATVEGWKLQSTDSLRIVSQEEV